MLFKKREYYTYRLEIHGMRCGMCEAHVNNEIRNNFKVKKVTSNHLKNETVILASEKLDLDKLREVIKNTGYELKGIEE